MLIDELMPDFDATIVEHVVIDAPPEAVYRATRSMDFLQIHSPMMDAAMFVRGIPLKIAQAIGNKPAPPPPPSMRLSDMFDGEADRDVLEGWLALGETPDRELTFGAIGKVWQPDIDWKTVPRDEFTAFDEPDYAKLVVGFSVRPYGTGRTILSYEARTQGTDGAATKKFLRYWWLVRRFVGHVMRAALATAKDLAERNETVPTKEAAATTG
jgi:hypothetical protein